MLNNILNNLKKARIEANITAEEIEKKLIFGPGWIDGIENGKIPIDLETLLSIISVMGIPFSKIFIIGEKSESQELPRNIYAVQNKEDIEVHFKYSKHDAVYILKKATVSQFKMVLKELRDGLARLQDSNYNTEAIKTDSVSRAFRKAVELWPHANPSDIWWFIIYRAYCDPFNHPAKYFRLSFEQSWKRTGGWALEEILVAHYGPSLATKGIKIFIANREQREELLKQIMIDDRLEADKADILLSGKINNKEVLFGIVHVKASFAERRTDDVPMSQLLVKSGYFSPLWTMDCKSSPSERPVNKGELGNVKKRKDIEDDSFFSCCFSYNSNTLPTPETQNSSSKIYVCDFNNSSEDVFVNKILEFWDHFSAINKGRFS